MRRDDEIIPYYEWKIRLIIILGALTVLLSVVYFLLVHFEVKNVVVEGNKHYSAKEIQDMIMTGYLGDNSLYLSLKYKKKEIENIPFIETMDVEVTFHTP